ncbi:hypothetical protein BDR22DRAFT_554453 [Usnea florida]
MLKLVIDLSNGFDRFGQRVLLDDQARFEHANCIRSRKNHLPQARGVISAHLHPSLSHSTTLTPETSIHSKSLSNISTTLTYTNSLSYLRALGTPHNRSTKTNMGHNSCPKCGAGITGGGKKCGSCGAVCGVLTFPSCCSRGQEADAVGGGVGVPPVG